MSYSQDGEDARVAKILAQHNIRGGRLLEIGAWRPEECSNSRALILEGWSAVLVEFSPDAVARLVHEYGNSPCVQVVAAAITTAPAHIERYQITDDMLSTADPAKLETWQAEGGYYGSLWVPTVTLEVFLRQFGAEEFDFVSIDTEGTSSSLAIEYLRLRDPGPAVMCIEHDDRLVEIMTAAQERGYSMKWANGTNMIIAR